MANNALRGDELVLQIDIGSGYVNLENARQLGLTDQKEIVDVTTLGSDGKRELLEGGGIFSSSVAVEGVFEESDLLKEMRARVKAGTSNTYRIVHLTSGFQREGDFVVSNFSQTGVYNEGIGYSFVLESTGDVVDTDTIS